MDTFHENSCPVKVQLLGGFHISYNGTALYPEQIGGQLSNLLAHMIVFRNKTASQEALIDALWPEGIVNPSSALKNLIYRLRKLLEAAKFPYAQGWVVAHAGSYHFHEDILFDVDCETFEAFCHETLVSKTEDAQIEYYESALKLYYGDFLPSLSQHTWVIPVQQYYHTLFSKGVYALLALYSKREQYQEMYELASHAVKIDPFDETVHIYILYALAKQGKQLQAIQHYTYISELFYRELGVELSESVRNMFREIAKSNKLGGTDILTFQKEWNENPKEITGAFYCELEVFKQLYRFEARTALRTGYSIFIGFFTLLDEQYGQPEHDLRDRAMSHMHITIGDILRKGDVFSRASANQYVVMLSMIDFENGQKVLSRIEKQFKSTFHSRKIQIVHNLQPLEPPVDWV